MTFSSATRCQFNGRKLRGDSCPRLSGGAKAPLFFPTGKMRSNCARLDSRGRLSQRELFCNIRTE